jgi:two-component system, OmpR family, sensor histidine kinase KdpD
LATIIAASSALLAQSDLTPSQRQTHLQRIVQQAEHLSRVSQNLLQLARLGANSAIHCDWESVEELLGSLLAQLPFRQRVQVLVPQSAPLIWCNGVLVNQALGNLLENAHRYGPADTSIALRARFEQQSWQFEVQDQGTNLNEEQAEQLQMAFLQGREGGHPCGVGLGLALCRAIAIAHQGCLSFVREPSSTWRLQLPQPVAPEGLPVS